jgi:hypothetical protein
MERGYIHLNVVNVVTISIAAYFGYLLLLGATILAKRVGIGPPATGG